MSTLKKNIGACLWLLLPLCVMGQEDVSISGAFHDMYFPRFVEQIESHYPYRFYYKPKEVDTLRVNVDASGISLERLLRRLFKNTEFNFAIDRERYVFITYGWKIETELPEDFFATKKAEEQEKPAEKEKKQEPPLVVDYFENSRATTDSDDQLYIIGVKTNQLKAGETEITGRVLTARTGEPVAGASVVLQKPLRGASTDPLGYYSLKIPRGKNTITFSSMGMRSVERKVMVYGPGELNAELRESVQSLKEVVVSAEQDRNITRAQMGVENLAVKSIKQIPSALGEADIVRAVLTLPGVKTVGEASTGFNVRGGSTDQNLILYSGAPIFNPSHLFGFFSSFNPDVVSGINLYKSSIPASYGGRLSSVLDIEAREGNKKDFVGSGGIGLVTSRLSLEGPIVKDKSSFLVAGRATYSDWVLKRLENEDYSQSRASFYDLNAAVSHEIDKSNQVFFNAYHSSDMFRFKRDTTYRYSNTTASLRWKSLMSEKLIANFTGAFSTYNYSVQSELNPVNAYELTFGIDQTKFKADFDYFLNTRHSLSFGIEEKLYQLNPGTFTPFSDESLVVPQVLEPEQGLESALFLSDEYMITPNLSIDAGLRYSMFNYLGSQQILEYAQGVPRSEFSVTDTTNYGSGANIQTYHGPEYRVALRYSLPGNSSVKASYNSLRQYIHMISNTTAISPTDIWKLSDPYIKPQFGQQLSLGYYQNFFEGKLETSVEVYYKKIRHYLDYQSGANLILNPTLETDIINTRSRAYGVEVLFKKTVGKLNGWLSYTWSRSLLQQDDNLAPEQINSGDWYPSNFDKPHDVTLAANYRFSHRVSFSLNFTYSTGRPITLPIAKYNYGGSQRVYYSERNAYRIPDYLRTDIALNIEPSHKLTKLTHTSYTFAIYNLTGRNNPYSVYYTARNGQIRGYKLSIFGNAIPTFTFNFSF